MRTACKAAVNNVAMRRGTLAAVPISVLPSYARRIGVHNWTDSSCEKLHAERMNHLRMETITTEMCDLLNEQTEWLRGPTGLLGVQSREEVDEYARRNERLRQLGQELSTLD